MHNLIQIQRTSFFTLFCGVCVFYKPIERHWDSTLPAKVMGYFTAFLLDCILDTYCIATNGKKKSFLQFHLTQCGGDGVKDVGRGRMFSEG